MGEEEKYYRNALFSQKMLSGRFISEMVILLG